MNFLFKKICHVAVTNHFTNSINNNIHSSAIVEAWSKSTVPTKFIGYNKKVYPPQENGEEPRPAVSISS